MTDQTPVFPNQGICFVSTDNMDMRMTRFESADLLVALCEVGQTSLAAKIARALFPNCARRHEANVIKRESKDGVVAVDESKASRAVELLERNFQPSRPRR